jgi:hypothetical protein
MSYFMGGRGEELPLTIEARAPRQHAAHVEPLPLDLPEHVRGIDTLGRRRVVRTAGGMDVMVSAEEPARRGIDPALELHRNRRLS